MIKTKPLWLSAALVPVFFGVLSGCQNTADGLSKDTENAAKATAKAAAKVGEKTSKAATDANVSAKDTGGNITAALEVTPRVKAAITADPELNNAKNHINVDSKDGIVHLKGSVSSNALKAKAGAIAAKAIKDGGGTDQVMNHLLVK